MVAAAPNRTIANEIQDMYVETDVRDEAILDWIDRVFPKHPQGSSTCCRSASVRSGSP